MKSSQPTGRAPKPKLIHEDEERELANTTDPKERKRIQNRVAQRIYRQKQKRRLQELEDQICGSGEPSSITSPPSIDVSALSPSDFSDAPETWSNLALSYPFTAALNSISVGSTSSATSRTSQSPSPQMETGQIPGEHKGKAARMLSGLLRAVGFISSFAEGIPPDTNAFLTVPYVPLSTAIVVNLGVMGVKVEQYHSDDATSPFLTGQFYALSDTPLAVEDAISVIASRAPDFIPTELQLRIDHHPYVDLIPFAGFRDKVLRALSDNMLDEAELCDDIETGLRIWGKVPWDARSCEWSQDFVDKWSWLMDKQSIEASNFWRAQRGEPRLRVTA